MEQRLRRAVLDRLELLGEEASNAEPGSLVTLARTEIRRLTDGWRELLANHQPDDDGRCPRCSGWFRRRRWPCPVWLSAHHHLIGEHNWYKQQRANARPQGPFGRRNPTIVVPRQLPATATRAALPPVSRPALPAGSPAVGSSPVGLRPDGTVTHGTVTHGTAIHRAAVADRPRLARHAS